MKKILFVFISIFVFFTSIGIKVNASNIQLPEGAIEYTSLDAVSKVSNYKFGNFNLFQNYSLYEKTDSTDFYLRVYVAEKSVSLPVQILTPIFQFTNNGRIDYEYIESQTLYTSYEEKISASINTEVGAVIKTYCGIPINNVTTTISSTMSTTLHTEITKKTELKLEKGNRIKFSLDVVPGFYVGERRAIYKYYVIQKVGIVYNLIRKGNNWIRGNEKRYALFETIGQFVCQGTSTSVVGIYEYERMSNGVDFQIVTKNLTDKDYIVYL